MVEKALVSNILVVEGDHIISDFLRDNLALQGIKPAILGSNTEVLDFLRDPKQPIIHIVCLNHDSDTGITGIKELSELATQITRSFPRMAVTIRSNIGQTEVADTLNTKTVDDVYSKHESPSVLASRVKRLLARFIYDEQ